MAIEDEIPVLTYSSIKLCGKDWTSGSKASFQPNFNQLVFTYTTSPSLSYIEARVTKEPQETDIGVGILADWGANISGNENHTITVDINSQNFNYGDGVYVISIYGKSSVNGRWTELHFFVTVDGLDFLPLNADGLEVPTTQDIPIHN